MKPVKKHMLLLTDGNIDQASARIRAIHYIPLFENQGFKVHLVPRTGLKPSDNFKRYFIFPLVKRYLGLKRRCLLTFKKWDIIFIQRSFIRESIMAGLKNKTPVIFDFDDAIYLSDKASDRRRSEIMVRYADEIIISSEYLNEFCSLFNKKATVIPSPVETDRIRPSSRADRENPVIGWIGSSWTTDYLRVVEPALQKLWKEVPFRLLTIGSRQGYRIKDIDHKSKTWSFEAESSFLDEMDIGIMPLPDNDFTRAKGGYKLYLYMAGGIPCVASPVGVNRSIIRDGENGFLASSMEEWVAALRKLLLDPELRKKMGQAGRNDSITHYDRSVCFEKLLERVNKLIL